MTFLNQEIDNDAKQIILETMKGLGISYSEASQARRKELQAIRKRF